jgi:mRNA-degrading endonuclease HigB of HigAB toxin-antitoxin module
VEVWVISSRRLQEAAENFGDRVLEKDLYAWVRVAEAAHWRNLAELRSTFPSADYVNRMVIFGLPRNRYRLITKMVCSRWFEPDKKWTPECRGFSHLLSQVDRMKRTRSAMTHGLHDERLRDTRQPSREVSWILDVVRRPSQARTGGLHLRLSPRTRPGRTKKTL